MDGRMKKIGEVASWNAQQLYDQYKVRKELLGQMVGSLYPRIVCAEMEKIEDQAKKRFGCHPNWFPEKGLANGYERSGKSSVGD
jgi:hypothetical protein